MRRESFELTESLLPDNPLEGLEPEPDVLANITARARARRRAAIEETSVTQTTPDDTRVGGQAREHIVTFSETPAERPTPEPHIVYFSATLEDGPVTFISPDGRRETLTTPEEINRRLNGRREPGADPTQEEPRTEAALRAEPLNQLPAGSPVDSTPAARRRTRRERAAPPADETESKEGRTQPEAINRESSRADRTDRTDRAESVNEHPASDIDLDDPDLMSGTHATTLRIDWEVIQGLKRIARDLSRPRKECTMGMLILHALKQTYPDLFDKP
jgi:hypothetical protein